MFAQSSLQDSANIKFIIKSWTIRQDVENCIISGSIGFVENSVYCKVIYSHFSIVYHNHLKVKTNYFTVFKCK